MGGAAGQASKSRQEGGWARLRGRPELPASGPGKFPAQPGKRCGQSTIDGFPLELGFPCTGGPGSRQSPLSKPSRPQSWQPAAGQLPWVCSSATMGQEVRPTAAPGAPGPLCLHPLIRHCSFLCVPPSPACSFLEAGQMPPSAWQTQVSEGRGPPGRGGADRELPEPCPLSPREGRDCLGGHCKLVMWSSRASLPRLRAAASSPQVRLRPSPALSLLICKWEATAPSKSHRGRPLAVV